MSATDTSRPVFAVPPADQISLSVNLLGDDAHLSINLSSNNPFRNRAASPALIDTSSESPFDDPAPIPRPVSRNPFFDQGEQPLVSPSAMSSHSESKSLSAQEIFDSLTLDDKASLDKKRPMNAPNHPRRPLNRPPGPPRPENVPPVEGGSGHRPTRSQEEAIRARKLAPAPRPGPPGSKSVARRPRRNSESSIIDLDTRPITAEERKMIEERRREEEKKRRGGREGREVKERSKGSKPSRRLDIIDQLDATSIYGTGLFHHDGPFDALNPHRNRHNSRRAPMQAFPKDSLNNSLGGFGPLNKQADHSTFLGTGTDEAFRDFSATGGSKHSQVAGGPPIFDSNGRESVIHGDETHGLGTSTFLEGTPAAKAAIVRSQAEQAQDAVENSMQRKKSLAHRIRNINKGPREYNASGRVVSPEGMYYRRSPNGASPGTPGDPEHNPFLAEFSKGEESINVRPRDAAMSPEMGPQRSMGGSLERRATTDATTTLDDAPAKPVGILGRMKSMKGSRKPRNADPQPGTAV
ncbi:hypothetical protein S40288_03161 [Stachybotrys chartarum IBT 40288]|nr:hypothetical protein S40288_03161 [Stachybotrys chartarum IBT 40288]